MFIIRGFFLFVKKFGKHMLRYFDHIIFCKVHSVDPINVCANFEINRYTH